MPPKSLKKEMLIFELCSTSDDWPSDPSDESQLKCKKGPLSHQKIKCSFLDYVQLLMISRVIPAMKVNRNVVSVRVFCCSVLVFCCFILGLLLFQSGSSVVQSGSSLIIIIIIIIIIVLVALILSGGAVAMFLQV